MKVGIAFIRGIGIFGSKNFTKKEVISCLEEIEDNDIRIIGMFSNDNIVFEKTEDIHYATVGSMIEKALSEEFGVEFNVTTRAFRTVKRLIEKYD
ncbi:MAG: DUF1697 domain-containing protein [Candidatus Thermoplasmatota archaeon]